MSTSNSEDERRKANLSNYGQFILQKLNRYVVKKRYTAEKLDALYNKYVRFLSSHISDYIVNKPIELQKEYYKEVVYAIFELNRAIEEHFQTQLDEEPSILEKIVDNLKKLSNDYIKLEYSLKPPPEAQIAPPELEVTSIEKGPEETRFAANTNIQSGGGFVSRLRSNLNNLRERAFSNTGNNPNPNPNSNPIPLRIQNILESTPVAIANRFEPTPPLQAAVVIPTYRRRIRDTEENNLTGGGGRDDP